LILGVDLIVVMQVWRLAVILYFKSEDLKQSGRFDVYLGGMIFICVF